MVYIFSEYVKLYCYKLNTKSCQVEYVTDGKYIYVFDKLPNDILDKLRVTVL